jgi:hypothetical protein
MMENSGVSNNEQEQLAEIRERLDRVEKKITLILEKLEIPYPPVENGHPGMSIGKGTL